MCLLIILREVVPDWPLVIAANREERYDRPSSGPVLLGETPAVFGGRDEKAGGTWLAVNQWAAVCAITNRPRQDPGAGEARSRGLLCLDAARQRSPIAVADMVGRAVEGNAYKGFNLVCAAAGVGSMFYYNGTLREKQIARGMTVITTGDANDQSIPKVRQVRQMLGADENRQISEWIERLEAVCRYRGGDPAYPEPHCVDGQEAGTVSSTIIALHGTNPTLSLYRHAAGAPCKTPYKTHDWPYGFFDVSLPPPTAYSPD